MAKCEKCGTETDHVCDKCGEPLCEDCAATASPPDLPIEAHICELCHAGTVRRLHAERTAELERELAAKEAAEKARLERNRNARARWNSPEAKAKRRRRAAETKEQALRDLAATLQDFLK